MAKIDWNDDWSTLVDEIFAQGSRMFTAKKLMKDGDRKSRQKFEKWIKKMGGDVSIIDDYEVGRVFALIVQDKFNDVATDVIDEGSYAEFVFKSSMPWAAAELDLETGAYEEYDDGGEDWEYEY